MRKKRRQDIVTAMLSGKMVTKTVTDPFGNTRKVQVFEPFLMNKVPTLHQLRKEKGHRFSDDEILTYERLRHMPIVIEREVFAKTPEEVKILKARKAEIKRTIRKAGFDPKLRLNVNEPQVLKRA